MVHFSRRTVVDTLKRHWMIVGQFQAQIASANITGQWLVDTYREGR